MGGRPPGRDLDELEQAHLLLLLDVREIMARRRREYDERLEDFVLKLREEGASVRGIAAAAGVGPSTVQTWTKNARRRRNQQP